MACGSQKPRTFDAVLLDLTMPKLSGAQALAEIRRISPGIPALLMSGYTADSVDGLADTAAFIQKPFTAGDLLNGVGQLFAPVGQTGAR